MRHHGGFLLSNNWNKQEKINVSVMQPHNTWLQEKKSCKIKMDCTLKVCVLW